MGGPAKLLIQDRIVTDKTKEAPEVVHLKKKKQ